MRPAFVTGGSSGIGLAVCRQLAQKGHPIAIFARDPKKLATAKAEVLAVAAGGDVATFAVDVADATALKEAITQAVADLGVPELAIASAGIAEPGHFLEQPLNSHNAQMAVNYGGSLNFVHTLVPLMKDAGGGQIGLISSGAAFFGIYGYSAYAPSKFALRGLAEVLRVELAPHHIGITLCYPPDTDTPQLAAEKRTKPKVTSIITGEAGVMRADDVAARLIEGMATNRFTVAPGFQMAALNRLTSLIAPLLRWWQAGIIRKESRK